MSWRGEWRPRPRLPLSVVPLGVYLGVTLFAPAVNGAAQREGFWEHAAITVAVSGLLALGWLGARAVVGFRATGVRPRSDAP